MDRTNIVIHPGALGDVLLAVPALRWIQAKYPAHRTLLISNEPVGRLLLECRTVDAWMPVEGISCTEFFSGSVPDSLELRRWLKACDLAVAWMKADEQGLAAALRTAGATAVRIQSPFSSQLKARHHSDRFLETLGATTAEAPSDVTLRLAPSLLEEGRLCLARMGIASDRPLALIHPGSGSRHKCTRAEVLAKVIDALREEGLCPLVIDGPADEAMTAQLFHLLPARPPVLRGLELPVMAGVMTQARVYIGHDSGITHLAALLRVPTLALFGPTDPEQWAPRGAHVGVLQGPSCACRSWNEVRNCEARSCLALSSREIIAAVRKITGHGLKGTTPRNPSQYALSQPIPCATVPS